MSNELRFDEAAPPIEAPRDDGHTRYSYCRAEDTGALIAIKNPRIEPDWTDDGSPIDVGELDGFFVFDAGGWRAPTEEECDDYMDDIRRYVCQATVELCR